MCSIKFVDSLLNEVPLDAPKEQHFAIDLGVRMTFAHDYLAGDALHFFVSAVPWAKDVDRKGAIQFVRTMEKLNAGVTFTLLSVEQINLLNYMGRGGDFEVRNSWTSSTADDWHGRVDGFCSLKDGKSYTDWGENITDLYVAFGFGAQQEKPLVFPE